MTHFAKRIVDSKPFRAIIIVVILLAGVLAGVETSPAMLAQHGPLLHALDAAVLAIFIIEIALKLASHGRRPLDYFRDGWNVFDFAIVAVCLLPIGGPFAAVLRLVRTLRLLRLVTALPKLQLLVGALIKSLSSMGYVGLLLGLIFYIYAVTGVHLFGKASPEYFGNLTAALLALFQMITLDDWRTMYDGAQAAAPFAATPYFVSFILLGTMIMLNLFIGIVMNSMAEMHTELDELKQATHPVPALDQLATLERQLAELRITLSMDHAGRTPPAQFTRPEAPMNAPFAETKNQNQNHPIHMKTQYLLLAAAAAFTLTGCSTTQTMTKETQSSTTPALALQKLKDGNDRFVAGSRAWRSYPSQVKATAKGQYPFATIVSCLDSRTSAELVFDQGLGDVFNARVAGNIVNRDIIGSLEFASKAAGSKLIAVIGHTKCGAVKGACDHVELGNLTSLLDKIEPAVAATPTVGGDRSSKNDAFVDQVAIQNVKRGIATIRAQSPILRQMERAGEIKIVGAMHDLETGRVTFLN